MRTIRPFKPVQWWRAGLVLSLLALVQATAQIQLPVITSIRQDRTNVFVQARVPAGIRRVTLECRDRVGVRSWEPRVVARLDGTGGAVTFQVARSRQLEVMRVRGDAEEGLPASFFAGTNAFLSQPASADGPVGAYAVTGFGDGLTPERTSSSREVVESDIWKIRGSTLYFFNQYRGLQIIDLTDPDAAVVRGTLELPAAGEQMYVLGTTHVVLLARDGCAYDSNQVLIVAVTNASAPAIVARLPVSGSIQESRLVGSALYVASQSYRAVTGTTNTTWEWGTAVSSFDLANPDAPVARNTLWYAGYGNVVAATDVYLFVVRQNPTNWWQSKIKVIDITDPAGTMTPYGSVTTAGRVPDKFKMDHSGTVFTTISEDWHWDGGTRLVTTLETWRLPDPRSAGPLGIIKLGELDLGQGERLRATRFDGERVYVVTFFQIDPLWVVDLSDPARPRIAGSVEIPGWSTYIEPLGDRLVTMGVETNRVAVSLFDVANPAAPALLDRVLLGQNYSWSEANYDEKAFTVLPGASLVLVPFSGDLTNGYGSAIQLIDLNRNSLAARGRIESDFSFRRATTYADRVISISGWEYLSVDASDRDHPIITGRLELAWPVDRVFLYGDYLIELGTDSGWGNPGSPTVRVALADAPSAVRGEVSLINLPVLGAAVRADRLYVTQGTQDGLYPILLADGSTTYSNRSTFVLTVIDLGSLPALPVLGRAGAETEPLGWGSDWQAVWPKPDVVVWVGGQNSWWRWCDFCPMPLDGRVAMASLWWPGPWFRGGNGGHLIAFDVSDPAGPQLASEVNLSRNNWWSFSKPFATDGLVYLSHQASEFVVGLTSVWQTAGAGTITADPATGRPISTADPIGTWVQSAYLNVIDYTEPRDPLVRKPVNIPGTLIGLSHQGALLYTTGTHWTTNTVWSWAEYLDASAYDGVAAHLIDSLPLPTSWPHPVQVVETNVFLGIPSGSSDPSDPVTPALETWTLSGAGKFTRLGRASLATAASTLGTFPGLLVTRETDNSVDLFDLSDPAQLRRVGRGQPAGCWWFDLTHADGDAHRGLWIPLGAFGVATVPVRP